MMNNEIIKKLAKQISFEVDQLNEGRKDLRKMRDELMEAGYKESAACKRIAEAINIDYRTLQKWLTVESSLSAKKFLEVLIFIDAYKEYREQKRNDAS
jgi:hypothetical protein